MPFRGFVLNDAQTRWPVAHVSAAHAASTCLRSSRSLHLSLRSTEQSVEQVTWRPVKHRLIESCLIYCSCKQKHRFCWLLSVSYHLETDDLKNIWSEIEVMNCHLYLLLRSESETKLPQCGSNFTRSWLPCEVKGALAGWWELNIKVSTLNCQTKKLSDAPFQGFVHMKLKHQPPVPEGKKVTNLLCVGTVWCVWMRAINFWNEFWIC